MRMIEQINAEQAAAIRAAAEKGDAKAQERLGDLCRFGEGVRPRPGTRRPRIRGTGMPSRSSRGSMSSRGRK